MEEVKDKTRHEQLKYRIRNKIDAETFACMPEELQDFLIESDPADMKDAYLSKSAFLLGLLLLLSSFLSSLIPMTDC